MHGNESQLFSRRMAAPSEGLRILFLLHATNYDRVFENFMRALLDRGHALDVRVDLDKRWPVHGSGLVFDRLAQEYPAFSAAPAPARTDAWLPLATRWRQALDYLRYMEPAYREAPALRERARRRAPALIRYLLEETPLGRPRSRARVGHTLRALEAALPAPEALRAFIAEHSPDVVVVSPLVGLGSAQGDYVRAAHALGIPAVLAVASWDNLTNKGRLREVPDLTVVWNAAQVEEAVTLHDLPRERVVATGAHAFDHWFSWRPSTSAEEFAAKVGLPEGRPLLLYVCSSRFIARDEVSFVQEWLRRIRASADPELRSAGVVIRPHPQHALQWHDAMLDDPAAVVWPQGGVAPIADQAKADYYDSLYHCRAVVGINTSAQVEAAILGRPVCTILDERFAHTQEGTLHFSHLTGNADAAVLTTARAWDEHLAQLAAAVGDGEAARPRLEGFVRTFIRPYGIDVAAAPRAAAAIEGAAVAGTSAPQRERWLTRALDAASPAVAIATWLHPRLIAAAGRARRRARSSKRLRRRRYRRARMTLGRLLGRGPTSTSTLAPEAARDRPDPNATETTAVAHPEA
jgi:hypothetical protein